jgi:hypothetical protein
VLKADHFSMRDFECDFRLTIARQKTRRLATQTVPSDVAQIERLRSACGDFVAAQLARINFRSTRLHHTTRCQRPRARIPGVLQSHRFFNRFSASLPVPPHEPRSTRKSIERSCARAAHYEALFDDFSCGCIA